MSAAVSQLQQKLPSMKARRFMSDAQYFNSATKNETLIRQLGSSSIVAKLEAMKKIIAQLSKGKDVSEFFADVVKNVACTSLEVKKLVYLYVMHYAEEKHDLALLSIAHFQKDMTDKSQHVRALSLRVLSSIRVPIIVQIVLLAIKKCMGDASPWVRKAAAIAVPKMYRLNHDEKPQLVEIIDRLLGDSNPAVLGAAAHAFAAVCPDDTVLMHKHYRKLVRGLGQADEWGQVVLLDVLLRYGRTQFLSPFKQGYQKSVNFYGGGGDSSDDDSTSDSSSKEELIEVRMDDDQRMLLDAALSLLASSNHAVVLGVAGLFIHLAPPHEFSCSIARALIRVMRSTREKQYVALMSIQTLASQRPAAFRPYIKQFFVTTADPIFTQKLKIDIMALLADAANVPTVLKEFKVYLHNAPDELLIGTVRALGRVAYLNSDVGDTCLNTLAELTTHPNEIVVGESVVVTRHLLQKVKNGQAKIICRLTKLLSSMDLPVARSSIAWLAGEYLKLPPVAMVAPDVFRQLVKRFADEDLSVKQQIVVLGAKLVLHDYDDERIESRVKALFQHLMTLVKYDQSYVLRDRSRLMRSILLDESLPELRAKAKQIFEAVKTEADVKDPGVERLQYQTGSLSHLLNTVAPGYTHLPSFPDKQPDPTTRDNALLSDSESSTTTESSSDDDTDDSDASSGSDSDSDSDSDDSSDATDSDDSESSSEPPARKPKASAKAKAKAKLKEKEKAKAKRKAAEPSSDEESSSDDSDSDSDSDSSSEPPPAKKPKSKKDAKSEKAAPPAKAEAPEDLLQFMGDLQMGAPASPDAGEAAAEHADPLASVWGFDEAAAVDSSAMRDTHEQLGSSPVPSPVAPRKTEAADDEAHPWYNMSSEAEAAGLSAEYCFPAVAQAYDGMTVVRVRMANKTEATIASVEFGDEQSAAEVTSIPFNTIADIAAGATATADMHVNWGCDDDDSDGAEAATLNDAPVRFSLVTPDATYPAVVQMPKLE
eukprot:Rhum_TRINITY_DN14025_c2_g1::Rhum_TRINITY_DN14025_c2_g1_i1::g.67877::m.67877/K12397/AP3B; AP-3 complex subunit beta